MKRVLSILLTAALLAGCQPEETQVVVDDAQNNPPNAVENQLAQQVTDESADAEIETEPEDPSESPATAEDIELQTEVRLMAMPGETVYTLALSHIPGLPLEVFVEGDSEAELMIHYEVTAGELIDWTDGEIESLGQMFAGDAREDMPYWRPSEAGDIHNETTAVADVRVWITGTAEDSVLAEETYSIYESYGKYSFEAPELLSSAPLSTDGWDMDPSELQVRLPYDPMTVAPNVPDYSWAPDLSDLHNAGQYQGFTEGQLDMINENGFVVLQENTQWPYSKMHYGYESAEYSQNPLIITSDIVLHMYRTYYSESMKTLELTEYLPDLTDLTQTLHAHVSTDYETADGAVKEELRHVYAYVAVASELLGISTDTPEEVREMVDYELEQIMAHSGRAESLVFEKQLDYSQYRIRGHYTLHEDLEKYFRTMMWYGQSGIQMTDDSKVLYEGISRACMLTDLVFRDEGNVEMWNDIYGLTKLYSGYSDDLNIYDIRDFMMTVYGHENLSYEAYVDVSYRPAINMALKDLRQPQIVGNFEKTDMAVGLECRLMGQRFTLDGYIMQELMKPIVRPMPTAFDVMTAFGHPLAEEILYDNYTSNDLWPGYDSKMAEMKAYVADYDDQWRSNLYNGWLWAIDAAAEQTSDKTGLPVFMANEAWDCRVLTGAMGSYAELKHDNVLYSKQPMAEMGGDWPLDQEYHYVEPNVELYNRLLWLASYTELALTRSGDVEEDVTAPLKEMADLLTVLRDVSVKELEGDFITDEEFDRISAIGGYIDYLQYAYASRLYEKGIAIDIPDTSALISDVATVVDDDYGDTYLEEATGLPYELYAVCQVNDTTFLARGWVFSYYEFTYGDRLNNEEWAGMIGFVKNDWGFMDYVGPAYRMVDVMPWTSIYVSDEANNVMTQDVELVWGD